MKTDSPLQSKKEHLLLDPHVRKLKLFFIIMYFITIIIMC